jgi:hypothetical protein
MVHGNVSKPPTLFLSFSWLGFPCSCILATIILYRSVEGPEGKLVGISM